ncbi:MAG TPA: hypothetical protein VFX16_06395 [Pseudonocardiaceae bacterium]|nr:hypothetical protein [Pseudonocardiaceae bacterium]
MSTTQWVRRLAVTGCAAGIGLAVAGAGSASAQGDPPSTQPAPITISSAQVEQLCTQRVPKLRAEVTKLINRIDGGPTEQGSTRWLQAQATKAKANGHPARADFLDGRAERRTGVLTILRNVRTKLDNFTSAHCGSGQ